MELKPALAQPDQAEEWCLGWKLESTRPLLPTEVGDLQLENNRLLRKQWGLGCGCPLVFFAPLFLFVATQNVMKQNAQAAEWAAGALVLLLLPSAWMLLKANDSRERLRGRHGDLKNGIVKRFSGLATDFERPDILLNRSNAATETPSCWIEVLPVSQQLFSINGVRTKKEVVAPIAFLAATPQSASSAAYWHQAGGGHDVTLRPLSADEKAELQRHSRLIVRRPFWGAVFLNCWVGLPIFVHWTMNEPLKIEPMGYFLIAMAMLANFSLWRTYNVARHLKQDAEAGEVALLRPPLKIDSSPPESGDASELRAALWEILPFSGLIWTADGKPSSWRKVQDTQSLTR